MISGVSTMSRRAGLVVCYLATFITGASMISCGAGESPDHSDANNGHLAFAAPSWSAAGVIAYADEGYRRIDGAWVVVDSLAGLWTVDVGTGNKQRIWPVGECPSWAPDGQQFTFRVGNELWVANMARGDAEQIGGGAGLVNPARWAPCSEAVVYVSTVDAPYDYTLWMMNMDTRVAVVLTPGMGGIREPVWYAGCDSILHSRYIVVNGVPVDSVYVMSKESLVPVAVLDSGSTERSLGASATGRYISYTTTGADGDDRIFIYDRIRRRYAGLSGTKGRDVGWAPSGERFVFVARCPVREDGLGSVLMVGDPMSGTLGEVGQLR